MSRILKRPMFRMGGSTGSGITSGLDTTKPKRGLVNEPGGYAGKLQEDMGEIVRSTAEQVKNPEILQSYRPYFERPAGEATSRFLTSFGLDLMSRAPTGNIFQTAALSAKGPTEQLYKDIDERRLMKSAEEADLFKTLIKAKGEALSGMGDDLTKTYSQIEIGKQIKSDIANIAKLETELQNKNLSPEEVQIKDLELKQTRANLNFLRKSNPIVESLLDNKLLRDGYINAIIAELVTDKEKYPKGYEEKNIYRDATLLFNKEMELLSAGGVSPTENTENRADGGRAGYKMGTPPGGITDVATVNINTPGMQAQEAMPMDQEPKIDFETLRARLPQEITNDIVQLIAASPEALEDFATIATQQDVDQFNKKYNVNLVLPQEG